MAGVSSCIIWQIESQKLLGQTHVWVVSSSGEMKNCLLEIASNRLQKYIQKSIGRGALRKVFAMRADSQMANLCSTDDHTANSELAHSQQEEIRIQWTCGKVNNWSPWARFEIRLDSVQVCICVLSRRSNAQISHGECMDTKKETGGGECGRRWCFLRAACNVSANQRRKRTRRSKNIFLCTRREENSSTTTTRPDDDGAGVDGWSDFSACWLFLSCGEWVTNRSESMSHLQMQTRFNETLLSVVVVMVLMRASADALSE
mmetsp:Transcript_10416/g.38674  ORF Transcript_10416/g.38674 Transcript_10416/m.38674 type:complete len:260 (+) Transcript_10416:4064-4843(+)